MNPGENGVAPRHSAVDRGDRVQFNSCPDCGAEFDADLHLSHEQTCPIGIGVDKASAADRRWFRRHRKCVEYKRPATWAEGVDCALALGFPGRQLVGTITVRRMGKGARLRLFDDCVFVTRTDEGVRL